MNNYSQKTFLFLSTNLFFQTLGKFNQNASQKEKLYQKNILFLSTGSFFRKKVFCKKKKCVDVRGMFEGKGAKRKGFYYKRL